MFDGNVEITAHVSRIPENLAYRAVRDRLDAMHPIHRLLSFRLRRTAQRLRVEYVTAVLTRLMKSSMGK